MTDVAPPHGLYTPEELYRLLPAALRIRDVEQGGRDGVAAPAHRGHLRPGQRRRRGHRAALRRPVHRDLRRLGGALHRRPHRLPHPPRGRAQGGVAPGRGGQHDRYRRRKGTASMLEQLARDVTGWPARVVEFFELLTTTQYMNHVRPHAAAHRRPPGRRPARPRLPLPGRRLRIVGPHRRDAPHRDRRAGGTTSRTSASSCGGSSAHRGHAVAAGAAADGSGRRFRFDPLGADSHALRRPPARGGHHPPRRAVRRAPPAHRSVGAGPPGRLLRAGPVVPAGGPAVAPAATPIGRTDGRRLRPVRRPRRPGDVEQRARARRRRSSARPPARPRRLPRRRRPRARPASAPSSAGAALEIGGGGYDRSARHPAGAAEVVAASGAARTSPPLLTSVGRRRGGRDRGLPPLRRSRPTITVEPIARPGPTTG